MDGNTAINALAKQLHNVLCGVVKIMHGLNSSKQFGKGYTKNNVYLFIV